MEKSPMFNEYDGSSKKEDVEQIKKLDFSHI